VSLRILTNVRKLCISCTTPVSAAEFPGVGAGAPGEVEESDFGAQLGEFGQVIAAAGITAARSAISSGLAGFGQRRQSPKCGGRYYGHCNGLRAV